MASRFEQFLRDTPDEAFREAVRNVLDTAFLVILWLEERHVVVNAETISVFTDMVLREHRHVVRERQREDDKS